MGNWAAGYIMPAMVGVGRLLDWRFDPLEALRRWPAELPALLLHSGRFHPRWARFSLLAAPVGTFRFVAAADGTGRGEWLGPGGIVPAAALSDRPFRDLRGLLAAAPGLWIGYLGYDLGRWIERLPCRATADRNWPIIELGLCPGYLVFEGATGQWRACGAWESPASAPVPALPDLAAREPALAGFRASNLRSVFDRPRYLRAVTRALEYIAAGDIFQANLAQRFTADFGGPWPRAARSLFGRLAAASPAWYGAYLELAPADADPAKMAGLSSGGRRRAIASTSPELFLEVSPAGEVVTRPIKGTRPASVPAEELRASAKDTAELNMIVDLLRNDLGRVCAYGSVRVPEPRIIESHPTIHHGVATVTGRLHEAKDLVDLLRATMPGGSVTGAPKIRAMEIIDELEPVRRGPYCGAIGYLSRDQGACLNIAIRTMLVEQPAGGEAGHVAFSVGGGIVADSLPEQEYEETLDKAAAMLAALGLGRPGT